MLEISENDILNRMRRDNPWWESGTAQIAEKDFPKRDYFGPFLHMVSQRDIRRAIILMGPRQVGKTVMTKQAISYLLDQKNKPSHLFFATLDNPLFLGAPLEKILRLYIENFGDENEGGWVIFDEIQYLKDWEIHLKDLVDHYPQYKFVATGSAASVLKRKSQESGAGRFSDFVLPPLSFAEFLKFQDEPFEQPIEQLNSHFLNYLAFGGYPEIVKSPDLRGNADQYLRSDIIDKVLLRDLPTLYGVTDIQESHRLFSHLVYNTGQEVSIEKLSQNSGVSKPTLKKYIEYFEGAFLIKRLSRIDDTAKEFKRERTFKIYVTNPALYTALFGALDADDPKMGALAETALITQSLIGYDLEFRYARWKDGEIDLVTMEKRTFKPIAALEIKWSDRVKRDTSQLKNLHAFILKNPSLKNDGFMSTRTYKAQINYKGSNIAFDPTANICYHLGENAVASVSQRVGYQFQTELEL